MKYLLRAVLLALLVGSALSIQAGTTTSRLEGLTSDVAFKVPVKAATTANITLSGAQTIDTVAIVEDDRVLVKDQTDASENGIYIAKDSTWTRAKDFNGARDATKGTLIYVTDGDANDTKIFILDTADPTIGTDDLSFSALFTTVGISDVVEDVTPQAGGDFDMNSFDLLFDDATGIRDDSDNELLIFQKTASAVNQFDLANAATGNAPSLSATGGDTNIDLILLPKGTGAVSVSGTTDYETNVTADDDIPNRKFLQSGYSLDVTDQGTKSTGTFTPEPSDGFMQKAINGGAHTLAAPTETGVFLLYYTNNGSAGIITLSGFELELGDALDTTDTNRFEMLITNDGTDQIIQKMALQ